MKKYLIISLSFLSILMLSGCGKKVENKEEKTNKESVSIVDYNTIKDKIVEVQTNIFISKENGKTIYYYINDDIVLIKADFIVNNYEGLITNDDTTYSTIIDGEYKLFNIYDKNSKIDEIELTNSIINKLIYNGDLEEVDIKSNHLFEYSGNELSGEKLVLTAYLSDGYYDDIESKYYKEPLVYIIDRETKKVQKIDPSLIKPIVNTEPERYTKIEPKPLNNYEIDFENKTIINKNNNTKYEINMNFIDENEQEIDGIYEISLVDDINYGSGILVYAKYGYIIEPNYDDVSCYGHTDESYRLCKGNNQTLINSSRLINITTGKLIYESTRMNEISLGKFVARKDNKDVLINNEGKELLKADYIGYNEKIGYVVIDNKNVKFYDESLKEKDSIQIDEEIFLKGDNNSFWVMRELLINVDIKNNPYFIYNGEEYSGKKLVLISTIDVESPIYIIENNKLVELDGTLSKVSDKILK